MSLQFNGISSSVPFQGAAIEGAGAQQKQGPTFGDQVEAVIEHVNDLQTRADKQASKLALGDVRSMHSVMIASEQASLALSTVLQVRNKAIESYQEIMRMQV